MSAMQASLALTQAVQECFYRELVEWGKAAEPGRRGEYAKILTLFGPADLSVQRRVVVVFGRPSPDEATTVHPSPACLRALEALRDGTFGLEAALTIFARGRA